MRKKSGHRRVQKEKGYRNRLELLYENRINKRGERIYTLKPSQFTDQDIKDLAKGVNDRLYKLEKAGLQEYSQEYKQIEKYAVQGYLNMYNVNLDKGTIRVTADMSRIDERDKAKYIRTLQNIMAAKTSTISGTRKAMKKAYKSFMKRPDIKKSAPNLTEKQYKDIWKAYRDKVKPNKKERLGSDVVLDFISSISQLGYYDISSAEISKSFDLWEESLDDPFSQFMQVVPQAAAMSRMDL